MNRTVLDASAILCLLNQEIGMEQVTKVLSNSVMSTVNVAEAYSKLYEVGVPNEEINNIFKELTFTIIPFDQIMAHQTGQLRPLTRAFGLSLGDRACLATAICLNLPVMTTDKVWQKLDIGIDVLCIR